MISYFILHLKGLEHLIKIKGDNQNHLSLLTRLVNEILGDQNLIRGSIECKIKKILYEFEYNKEIEQ